MFLCCVLKVLGGALSEESNKAAGKDAGARLKLASNPKPRGSQCLRSSVKEDSCRNNGMLEQTHVMQKLFTAMQY
jgi:hypothetical protein